MPRLNETLLADYALDLLSSADRAEVEAMLARSGEAREALSEICEALSVLGETLPPVQPSATARSRLLAAAEPRPRLTGLARKLADLVDLGAEWARELLARIDDADLWEPSPWGGVSLHHLPQGPRIAAAVDAGLVRVQPCTRFPYHVHGGREEVLVLQGGFVDHGTGRTHLVGDLVRAEPGSGHAYSALDGPDLLYAVVLYGPLEFPG